MAAQPRSTGEPTVIAVVSLEDLHGYFPDSYVGLVLGNGSSAFDAVEALERRALQLARQSLARHAADPVPTLPHVYAVLGMKLAAGTSASGQPEWVAYGTLARGFRQSAHQE
jgi:hypothetical protein